MLLLTSQAFCMLNIYKGKKTSPSAYLFRFAQRQVCNANVASPPLLKGEALSKITLSGIYTNTKALLLGELAACTPERSKTPKDITRSLSRGRATPPLFLTNPSKIVRLRGGYSHTFPTLPISRRSAQDDLLKGSAAVILSFLDNRGRRPYNKFLCLSA